MRRGGTWLAAAGAVLALSACGGGGEARPEEPGLPRGLAERLAEDSEAIAARLDAGDTCEAAQQADALKDEAEAAIAAGDVPPELQSELIATIDELVNTVNCPQPPPPSDCEALEEEKQALEEQKEDAEDEEKKQLEEQIKALEEQIKEACEEGNGGEGEGKGEGKGNSGGDD